MFVSEQGCGVIAWLGGFMADIVIENECVEVVLSTIGGAVQSIVNKLDGMQHYWQYDSRVWPRRTSVCFPVCGKLNNDSYTYGGRRYSLQPHGFLRQREFAVVHRTSNTLMLQDSSDQETRDSYPFDYRLNICYRLDGNQLEVLYTVCNTGSSLMLYSIGSHFSYRLVGSQQDAFIWFSKPQRARAMDPDSGSCGMDVFCGRESVNVRDFFKNGSKIFRSEELDTQWIGIGSSERVFTKVCYQNADYVVLWTPKGMDADFVCIEPWAGIKDSSGHNGRLEDKIGIQRLEKGCSELYSLQIEVCKWGQV